MVKQVRLLRENTFIGHGKSGCAFHYTYRLECAGFQGPTLSVPGRNAVPCDYAGTPLKTLRGIAQRIAREHGAEVVETWKGARHATH